MLFTPNSKVMQIIVILVPVILFSIIGLNGVAIQNAYIYVIGNFCDDHISHYFSLYCLLLKIYCLFLI